MEERKREEWWPGERPVGDWWVCVTDRWGSKSGCSLVTSVQSEQTQANTAGVDILTSLYRAESGSVNEHST